MANLAALPVLLKELKLSSFTQHWERLAQKALDEQWLPQTLPGKQLNHFDFTALRGIKQNQITALTEQRHWVKQAENVLLFGASGLGKTHLACAIGYALIEQGIRVRFTSATHIVQQLQQAKGELTLAEALTRLDKYAVLIIDDMGYVKKSSQETQVLFELIAHRYETGSVIITSNQPFSAWDQIFEDNMMTVAAIDRLVHHATILEIEGESYRKQASMKRRKKKIEN